MRWGGHRAGSFPASYLLFVVLLLAAAALARPALAVDLVDVSRPVPQQNLAGFLAGLQTDQRTITIERPDGGTGAGGQMMLTAKGPGPLFNWVAAGFSNRSGEQVSVILAVPHQGFTGSGFHPPRLAGPRVYGTALGGFGLIMFLWWRGEVKAETVVLSWTAILLWTMLAVLAALGSEPGSSIAGVVVIGLAALLVILGFVLAHHAFAQGYLSRHFFREAGRHALALAGARAFVWDWQPEEGELFLSPEIARALAQPANAFEDVAGEAFLELMHPADRSAYLATIAEAEADGRNPIERKFRLRHGDGSYRWFDLRARSITGGNGFRAARCIGTITDVTNAKIAEERLLKDAVYDMVTGLPNRALFADRLQRAIDGLEPGAATALFVLLIDLDRFKTVNDAMGHEAGDALLSIIGRRLKAEAEMVDTVARLPGDQFAILYHEVPDGRTVDAFAQALLQTVARPVKFEEQEYFLTASIGVAQYRPEVQDADRLMKDAAVALYEARRKGMGAVELFNPLMVDDRAELVVLEAELRRAIERNEIEVHYQPIARLADMHLAGFEALVRWRHPSMGLLAPESFLGLAEETGMIRDIGRVVLNEAGRQLGIWQRAYRTAEPAFVAVNISSAQLIEPGLLDDVKQIISREGLMRGSFKIEVTESLVMEYPERATQILERFRELGVGLSCDDFGTGYSSLSSLRKLPFDTLKVDRSFIAPEAQDHRAVVILQSIIAMGHDLGLAIVAEGIENQDQVDRLGELGCDFGQGFFIGKPLSAKQVNDALAGLPYAHTSGRTAITWLWERAIKDPPPEPALRRVTAEDVRRPEPEKRPARPFPRRRMEPDPEPKVEAVSPEAGSHVAPPTDALVQADVEAEVVVIASEEAVEAVVEDMVEDVVEDMAAGPADEMVAELDAVEPPAEGAASVVEVADPPPVRRRRKRQRRVSLPSNEEA